MGVTIGLGLIDFCWSHYYLRISESQELDEIYWKKIMMLDFEKYIELY